MKIPEAINLLLLSNDSVRCYLGFPEASYVIEEPNYVKDLQNQSSKVRHIIKSFLRSLF